MTFSRYEDVNTVVRLLQIKNRTNEINYNINRNKRRTTEKSIINTYKNKSSPII